MYPAELFAALLRCWYLVFSVTFTIKCYLEDLAVNVVFLCTVALVMVLGAVPRSDFTLSS